MMLRVALAWGVCVALALGAPGMAAAGNLIVNGHLAETNIIFVSWSPGRHASSEPEHAKLITSFSTRRLLSVL